MPTTRTVVRRGMRAAIEAIDDDGSRSWFVRCNEFSSNQTFASLAEAETHWRVVESDQADFPQLD